MKDRSHVPLAAAGVLVVVAATAWMISDRPAFVSEEIQPDPEIATPLAPISATGAEVAMALPAPEIPPDLPPPKPRVVPSPEALKDIEDVQFMLRDFRTRLGANPTGTNAEIMKEVMGANRAQMKLSPPEGQKMNDQGELLDRWGAPYFFHQLSRNEMEIRSAGPDGAMWTNDDVVMK